MKKVLDPRFSHFEALPVINDQSLMDSKLNIKASTPNIPAHLSCAYGAILVLCHGLFLGIPFVLLRL